MFEAEIAALQDFACALEEDPARVPGWEGFDQVYFEEPAFPAPKAAGLKLDQLKPFAQAFAGALTCQFSLLPKDMTPEDPDPVVLDIHPGIRPAELARFRERIQSCQSLNFYFTIQKSCLLEKYGIGAETCAFYLYLFPSALQAFLNGTTAGGESCSAQLCLKFMEEKLWPSNLAHKAVLLVEGQDIYLDGNVLAVLGGAHLDQWQQAIPAQAPDFDSLRTVTEQRKESVAWDEPWVAHLTPPHLKLDQVLVPSDPILPALQVHLLNLVVLFSANRTAGSQDDCYATYADDSFTREIRLLAPGEIKFDRQRLGQIDSYYKVFTWAYHSAWPRDRLTIVQNTVAQELAHHSGADAYQVLLDQSGEILSTLDRRWRQFTQGKIKKYTDEELKLEEFVVKTVDAFAERVSAMVNAVSETMLAAIAALFGSFIAAGFGNQDFNVLIFALGMLAYSLYVLAFPLLYSMSIQWTQYRAIYAGMQAGLKRFSEQLGDEQAVKAIVGERLAGSNQRFKLWFVITSGIYLVAIALGILTAATALLLVALPKFFP